jgi:hypothetical protein
MQIAEVVPIRWRPLHAPLLAAKRSRMKNAQTPTKLKPKTRRARKTGALISQADRARTLAASCRAPLIAEPFEIHAQVCERNALKAKGRQLKRTGRSVVAEPAVTAGPMTFFG